MNQTAPVYAPRYLRYLRDLPIVTSSRSSGRYKPLVQEPHQAFYAILNRWLRETKYLSDPEEITGHPAFADLVRIAPRVLSEVEAELRRGPSLLVWALEDAFGLRPYDGEESDGDIARMTEAWLDWFERAHRGPAR